MGVCQTSQIQTNRDYFQFESHNRCIIAKNSRQILIEQKNGTILSFPITILDNQSVVFNKVNITHTSSSYQATSKSLLLNHQNQKNGSIPQLYFSHDNKIYYIQTLKEIDQFDPKFIKTAYAYYLLHNLSVEQQKKFKINNIGKLSLKVSEAYLIRQKEQNHYEDKKMKSTMTFIIQSDPLQAQGNNDSLIRFVDLTDLGRRMKEKGICWQDKQYSQIINLVCQTIAQLQKLDLYGVTNIIIGSDGSIRAVGKFDKSNLKNQPFLKNILLTSLYGINNIKNEDLTKLQQKCKFKHPNSLDCLENLSKILKQQAQNTPTKLKSPYLKFVQGYIEAYFYKMELFSQQTLETYLKLGKYQEAKKMCSDYIISNRLQKQNSKQSHKMYQILVMASEKIRRSSSRIKNSTKISQQQIKSLNKLEEICYHLGSEELKNNKYAGALRYFSGARQTSLKNPSIDQQIVNKSLKNHKRDLYVKLFDIVYSLGQYHKVEEILTEGINRRLDEKLLSLFHIFYLCDCFRIQQAQNYLYTYTKIFSTFELELCSAKILLIKALGNSQSKGSYLTKAEDCLKIIQETTIQGEQNSIDLLKTYYYEIWGDLKMLQKRYSQASICYHDSQIFIKKQTKFISSSRLILLMSAEANCLQMQRQYMKAQALYKQALECVSYECKSIENMIRGNLGVLKIKIGMKSEGLSQIQSIVQKSPDIEKKQNCNYLFFEKMIGKNQ